MSSSQRSNILRRNATCLWVIRLICVSWLGALLVNCSHQPVSQLTAGSIPADLAPIRLDSRDADDGPQFKIYNIRMQPAPRREFTVRLKQLVVLDGKRVSSEATYKGFTIVTPREDGKTTFSTYVERIDGSVYPIDIAKDLTQAIPIWLSGQPFLVLETHHNADNSIDRIELPFFVDLLRSPDIRNPSLQNRATREQTAVRFIALKSLADNLWVLLPVRASRLQIGRSVWPESMHEISQLFTNEIVPAMARSSTIRTAFELSPPAERAKFGNPKTFEEFSQSFAKAASAGFTSLFSDQEASLSVPVTGTGVWEGQDVLEAHGPFRTRINVGSGQSIAQVNMIGSIHQLIDPYSGQTVRLEYGASLAFMAQEKQGVVELNISMTTLPSPTAPRVQLPPVLEALIPPSQPSKLAQPRSKNGQGAGRISGDLPIGGAARRISDIYRDSIGAIFTVVAGNSQGSGFAVDATHVLTNRHVVEGMGTTIRLMQNGALVATARAEKIFEGAIDLAILRVDNPLTGRPLELAPELPQIGAEILIIGAPIGLDGSVTGGMVSQLRFFENAGYLQINALINPGNSGGPVLDRLGRVVGIATSRLLRQNQVQGIGFALGSETIRNAIKP